MPRNTWLPVRACVQALSLTNTLLRTVFMETIEKATGYLARALTTSFMPDDNEKSTSCPPYSFGPDVCYCCLCPLCQLSSGGWKLHPLVSAWGGEGLQIIH